MTHERRHSAALRRWLIVNADDFGISDGVNAGIVEAHAHGIVTSTSLMVTMPAASRAVALACERPTLSLGIHVDLTGEGHASPIALDDVTGCRIATLQQVDRFFELVGRVPTHVDAHHNVHRLAQLESVFVEVAEMLHAPLREHSDVRYFPDFYAQWDDGCTHPEWVAPENLRRMLDEDIGEGITELSCHPGRVDPNLVSTYHAERELELRTLCDPVVRDHIDRSDLALISYHDVAAMQPSAREP